ncbi:aminobutyraldehyde dehydrogenase [Rhizobium sp. KVB221]|uniref:Salicylaldehyde dehydrogenase n=1 Tax=Rhizobium setariae TaxID=2801340 RepID=A0A937CQ64_9HYPH|nr:aminobutyraldehyde dehydrogenase [Rhizobium setariae]MBL0373448.1 aminobutyraldehyde dehydrogenase [Rhizobium setariae]
MDPYAISKLPMQHFIGGVFTAGHAVDRLAVFNPARAEPIFEIPRGTAADVEAAVAAARRAQRSWALTTPSERSRLLYRLADSMEAEIETLVAIETLNVGKPRRNAHQETRFAIDLIRFCAGAARCMEGKAAGEYLPGHTSFIRREPLGIVAGITPWNYPIVMLAYKLGPALATGNVLILKPAEQTPLTTLKVAELAAEILPPGVFNVVTGDEVAGAAIVRHPDIRLVSLTGSTATGRIIAREATSNLKRVHLELGGKAPVVVLDDADLDAVVAGLRKGAFYNSGQDCTAATRVIAAAGIYDRLRDAVVEMAKAVRVGDPDTDDTEMGPLVSAEQLARVSGFMDRARATKANVLTGGLPGDPSGYFFAPTIVADVEQNHELVQHEVFGPVLTLQKFGTEAEAIAFANGTDFGLGASLWTQDVGRAMALSRDIQAGAVWVNCHDAVTPEMPHGGVKCSGYGKDLSMYSLEDYSHIKHVMVRHETA